jgi:hypothetical protein
MNKEFLIQNEENKRAAKRRKRSRTQVSPKMTEEQLKILLTEGINLSKSRLFNI